LSYSGVFVYLHSQYALTIKDWNNHNSDCRITGICNPQQSKIQNMFNYSNIIKYVGTGIVIVGTTLAVRGGMKDSMKHRGNMDDLR
jgi:hypothetical protein